MKCRKCQEENPDGTRFCRRCGEQISGVSSSGGVKVLLLAAAMLVAGLVALWVTHMNSTPGAPATVSPPSPPAPIRSSAEPVTVGIAYGTEKQDWLQWAVAEFAGTPEGQNIKIDLKPMGSVEAAQAIAHNDKSIQVWSPASSLYKDVFVRDWKDVHAGSQPILQEAPLALTPMVFVMWEERYDAFMKHYQELSFRTVGDALSQKGGWNTIANKPDWMFFKFSHTNPGQSNSGLMALVLMGYDYHAKHAGLDGKDITDPAFQDWVRGTERSLTGAASGLNSSTGYLMTSMVQRGWSTYDAIFVYESVALDRLKQANGRWGPLKVVYPKYNMWNDNPYYILDVPWSTAEQRRGAQTFLTFLLSDRVQAEAMVHGFRPANIRVPTRTPESPFVKYESVGIRSDVPGIFCEPPRAEVIENLLLAWQRSQAEVK
jgi:hypothetical protein